MRILIIEDVTINIRLLQNLLSAYGTCDVAKNGFDGLKAFTSALHQNKPYDLICLDIVMPGMSGLEVLKEIRRIDEGRTNVKILMTTSLAEVENVEKAIQYGCDGYLIKPYNKQILEDHLITLNLHKPDTEEKEQPAQDKKDNDVQADSDESPEQETTI